VALLHGVLAYYAEMARHRREVDQLIHKKNTRAAGNGAGTDCRLGQDPVCTAGGDALTELAERVRARRGMRCNCPGPSRDWDVEVEPPEGRVLVLWHSCRRCDFKDKTESPVGVFRYLLRNRR
jgi:hypothetical protein